MTIEFNTSDRRDVEAVFMMTWRLHRRFLGGNFEIVNLDKYDVVEKKEGDK